MRNKFEQRWNNLMQSQRGAALLMVLLVTVFVIIMGSSVMFTSYNSYIMRLVDREGVDTFYDTEELTDLVRVNVQDAASEALQTAYTRVMSEYAFIQAAANFVDTAVQQAAQDKFNEYFIEELARYYTAVPQYDSSGVAIPDSTTSGTQLKSDEHLFLVDQYSSLETALGTGNVTGSMSTSALEGILSALLGEGNVTVSGTGSSTTTSGPTYDFDNSGNVASFTYTFGDDGYPRLTIKDVTVSYVTDGGYETNITTDIIIEMPMFIHTGDISQSDLSSTDGGNQSQMGLPFDNASSIAKYWVKQSSVHNGGLVITGDIYAGTFFVYNGGVNDPRTIVFSHGGGRLITHNGLVPVDSAQAGGVYGTGSNLGDYITLDGIVIHGGTSFTSQPDSEIWTNSVTVREGSDVTLAGERGSSNPYKMPDRDDNGNIKTDEDGNTIMVSVTNLTFGGTFVKDDLTIFGGILAGEVDSTGTTSKVNNISNIVLSGDYYGFSTGNTGATSSAIVMNGSDIDLDMGGLKEILLGGTTYLQVGRSTGFSDDTGSYLNANDEYEMGQSIAATPDALAYMIPWKAISGVAGLTSNPMATTESFSNATIISSQLPSWVQTLVTSEQVLETPQVISRSYGDTRLVYFFYQFKDDTARSDYIEAYILNEGTSGGTTTGNFQNNLELFVNFKNASELEETSAAAGVVYYLDDDENLQVMNSGGLSVDDGILLSEYEQQFANAAVTLWPEVAIHDSVPSTGYWVYNLDASSAGGNVELQKPNNPFDYYVNMQGDNLWINYEYTYNGGKNFDGTEVDGLGYASSPDPTQADMYAYFDHDKDGLYNPVYGAPTSNTSNNNEVRRIGLEAWVNESSEAEGEYYEFVLDGKVVALYKANGLKWDDGGGPDMVCYDTESKSVPGTYEDVVMLIGRAGVQIQTPFEGLVFSETGIAISSSLDSINMGFETILNAYCVHPYRSEPTTNTAGTSIPKTKFLYEFFRNLDLTYEGGQEDGSDPTLTPGVSEDDAKVNWSPNDLVYYENWEKH